MRKPFLTAQWKHLCLLNYSVPRELLEPRLPPGLVLDEREGKAYVSLVGFNFEDTRVFGVPWPGYRSFPELNLRYYVRHGERRGVVFLREFVQSRFVCWMARTFYNEPYYPAPLRHEVKADPQAICAETALTFAGRVHRFRVEGDATPMRPAPDSVEHHFKEHQWGFGADRKGRLSCYEVWHPEWEVFPVRRCDIEFDFAAVYGPEWRALTGRDPDSVVFALGSEIKVFPKADR